MPTTCKTMGESDAALTHIGKTGLERYYEDRLRGEVGYEKIETNVEGRPMRSARPRAGASRAPTCA